MTLRTRHKAAQSTIKPAPNAGLMLFVADDSLPCDWARLVLAEKDVDSAQVQAIRPGSAVNEDFLVLNPSQSLPTLADREGVIIAHAVPPQHRRAGLGDLGRQLVDRAFDAPAGD